MTHSSTWPQEQMKRLRINLQSQFLYLSQVRSTLMFIVSFFLSLYVYSGYSPRCHRRQNPASSQMKKLIKSRSQTLTQLDHIDCLSKSNHPSSRYILTKENSRTNLGCRKNWFTLPKPECYEYGESSTFCTSSLQDFGSEEFFLAENILEMGRILAW